MTLYGMNLFHHQVNIFGINKCGTKRHVENMYNIVNHISIEVELHLLAI